MAEKFDYRFEQLTKANWVAWKCHTLRVLRAMGLEEYVLEPEMKDSSKAHRALAVLSSALDAEHRHATLNCNTARDLWTTLEAMFENKTITSLGHLIKRFSS